MSLAGRCALVTGASRGIGRAVAQSLIEAGAWVAIWSRDVARNAATVSELSDRAIGIACDVTNEDQVRDAMAKTMAAFGKLDICVACAGTAQATPMPIEAFDLKAWRTIQSQNVESALLVSKYAAPHLKQSSAGRLIFFSSVAARLGIPMRAGYSASKAALEAITRSLAAELAVDSICVNAIAPGYLDTDMTRAAGDVLAEYFRSRVPNGQLGVASDAAAVSAFLASDNARYLTGQIFVVDGGFSIG